jgi:hypothetical protein
MNYKNDYKVVYEVAANGERTFYAAKSNVYPNRNEAGEIIDTKLASFKDADFAGKTIYEYKGEFYVSTGSIPAYDEDGVPTDNKIEGFNKLFVEETMEEPVATTYTRRARKSAPVVEEPVIEAPVEE